MVKPNPVGVGVDGSIDPSFRDAELTAERLELGEPISKESLDRTKEVFLDRLRAGSPATEGKAREGLVILFEKTPDNVERAGIIGELLGVGPKAGSAFGRVSDFGGDFFQDVLRPDEWGILTGLLDRPVAERLEAVVRWLADEVNLPEPGQPLPPEAPEQPLDAILPPGRVKEETEGDFADGDGGPDPDGKDLGEILIDRTLPEEVRCRAAERMGTGAVPILERLAKDDKQREFAAATLAHLGSRHGLDREIYRAGERLERDPEHRALGEMIRMSVRSRLDEDASCRHSARDAGLRDAWLSRALSSCDAPSILMAAAGREAFAIPLVLRKLAQLRTSRL